MIARESKQLVYSHFNMVVAVSADADMQKCTNYLENAFGRIGIHISKHAYNQLELFVGSFPGNCYSLNEDYDRFLTLSDAAMCLMYKERVPHSEDTPLKVYYTDRQGVPIAIDIMGKEGKNKLTDNSNFFCLGPSGSGKSFHMNSVVRQLHEQGTDVVMVDTGNSYEGLCEYLGGKYIAYTEEKPITMNPFKISRNEYNIEKIDFLKSLILMIWKGSDAKIPEIEFRIVEQIIIDYYDAFFNGFSRYSDEQRGVLPEKPVRFGQPQESQYAAQRGGRHGAQANRRAGSPARGTQGNGTVVQQLLRLQLRPLGADMHRKRHHHYQLLHLFDYAPAVLQRRCIRYDSQRGCGLDAL